MVPQELSRVVDETSLHEALANTRRQQALYILQDAETSMSLAELTKEVAERDQERPEAEPNEELIESLHLSLYHVHVPKLEALGLVEFNPVERTVAPAW